MLGVPASRVLSAARGESASSLAVATTDVVAAVVVGGDATMTPVAVPAAVRLVGLVRAPSAHRMCPSSVPRPCLPPLPLVGAGGVLCCCRFCCCDGPWSAAERRPRRRRGASTGAALSTSRKASNDLGRCAPALPPSPPAIRASSALAAATLCSAVTVRLVVRMRLRGVTAASSATRSHQRRRSTNRCGGRVVCKSADA